MGDGGIVVAQTHRLPLNREGPGRVRRRLDQSRVFGGLGVSLRQSGQRLFKLWARLSKRCRLFRQQFRLENTDPTPKTYRIIQISRHSERHSAVPP